MKSIKKNFDDLKYLATCKPTIRKVILANADQHLINAICECVLNVLNGNIKVDPKIFKKLKQYKKVLRTVVCKKKSVKKSQKIIQQTGGSWIPLLIPPILEVVKNILNI